MVPCYELVTWLQAHNLPPTSTVNKFVSELRKNLRKRAVMRWRKKYCDNICCKRKFVVLLLSPGRCQTKYKLVGTIIFCALKQLFNLGLPIMRNFSQLGALHRVGYLSSNIRHALVK